MTTTKQISLPIPVPAAWLHAGDVILDPELHPEVVVTEVQVTNQGVRVSGKAQHPAKFGEKVWTIFPPAQPVVVYPTPALT